MRDEPAAWCSSSAAGPVAARPCRVRLSGLDPAASLRVRGSQQVVTGVASSIDGVAVPFARAADCDVVVLERV